MKINVVSKVYETHLEAVVSGAWDLNELSAAFEAAAAEARRNGLRCLLFDELGVSSPELPPQRLLLADRIAPSLVRMRVAVVMERDNHGQAFEDMAVNRGLKVRRFDSAIPALSWLLDDTVLSRSRSRG